MDFDPLCFVQQGNLRKLGEEASFPCCGVVSHIAIPASVVEAEPCFQATLQHCL